MNNVYKPLNELKTAFLEFVLGFRDEHIGKNIITLFTINEIPVFSPLSIVLQTITTDNNGNCEAETKVNIR